MDDKIYLRALFALLTVLIPLWLTMNLPSDSAFTTSTLYFWPTAVTVLSSLVFSVIVVRLLARS